MKQNKYVKMLYPSPIGPLSLVADEPISVWDLGTGQTHFERGLGDETIEVVASHSVLEQVTSYLDTYFRRQCSGPIYLPLAPIGTDFEKGSGTYLQAIPYGQTVTYGQIAQDLQVASAQAIGGAVGRNPWSIPRTLSSCAGVRQSLDRLCIWSRKEGLALAT